MLKGEIIGNIGRDAEVVTINDKTYTKFSVAHTPRKGETVWVSVLYYGDGLAKWLKKGAGVFASGDLSCNLYETKNGSKGVDITIWAREVQITKFPDGEDDMPSDIADKPF